MNMEKNHPSINLEHTASAAVKNVAISMKQCVEISNCLRYHSTSYAKQFVEEVANLQRAVPFRRYNKDMGHKPGMAAGRFPQKAAKVFLTLLKSVEANAQVQGLDPSNLKIVKLMANQAAVPFGGGRLQHGTKRSHIEVVVAAGTAKAKTETKSEKKTARAPRVRASKTAPPSTAGDKS